MLDIENRDTWSNDFTGEDVDEEMTFVEMFDSNLSPCQCSEEIDFSLIK